MSKRPFEPVTFTVSILRPDRQHFEEVAEFVATSKAEQTVKEREAYAAAAQAVEQAWPGQWTYAYGDLDKGDYSGQFQWKEGGLGSLVPASVHEHDPQANRRYEAARTKERAAERRKEKEIAKLPPMRFVDGGEKLWQSWLDANPNGYGGAVMIYARQWAQVMQRDLDAYNGASMTDIHAIFERASHEADTVGLSGAQWGFAVRMLVDVWEHCHLLRAWNDQRWGVMRVAEVSDAQ